MSMSIFLSAALLASGQAAEPPRHPTWVLADQDDDLTQKFAEAIRHALPNAKHMRLANGDDKDDLTLAVLFKLNVEGRHFDYAVDLMKATGDPTPERLDSFTGRCKVDAVDACARDLVKKADGDARKSGES